MIFSKTRSDGKNFSRGVKHDKEFFQECESEIKLIASFVKFSKRRDKGVIYRQFGFVVFFICNNTKTFFLNRMPKYTLPVLYLFFFVVLLD